MTVNFSSETREARRNWHIFQVLNGKNCQPRIQYPVKISFKNEGEINTFSEEELVQDLYAENYKMLMKKIKDLNKWRDILCSWIGK